VRALLAAILLAYSAAGDEIVLRSGARISGEVVEERPDAVVVRLARGLLTLPRDRVERIVREGGGDYLRREAGASHRAGLHARAAELYERALAAAPGDAEVRAALVEALRAHAAACASEMRAAEARAALRRLLELAPSDAAARSSLDALDRDAEAAERALAAARASLEAGRFAEAIALLHEWRGLRPPGDPAAREALGEAHARAGDAALDAGAPERALQHFRAAAAYGERRRSGAGLVALAPLAALTALEEGDLEEARRTVEGISGSYPDPGVPLLLRAVLRQAEGAFEEAARLYSEAERAALAEPARGRCVPFPEAKRRAASALSAVILAYASPGAERWRQTFLDPLQRFDGGEFFAVYAPTEALAREASAAADAAYRRAAVELLGAVPSAAKAELVIHPNRDVYLAADLHRGPGGVSTRERSAGITYEAWTGPSTRVPRIEAYAGGHALLHDTIPHEAAHVVQRRGLGAFRRMHWLDEGIATLFESEACRRARRARFLASVPAPLPEFVSLQATPAEDGAAFYDQAHALAEFLRARVDDAQWRRFLALLGTRSFEDCLRDCFDVESVDALERLWLSRDRR
jgi:tetratricopeptide (TPR) repeat protein